MVVQTGAVPWGPEVTQSCHMLFHPPSADTLSTTEHSWPPGASDHAGCRRYQGLLRQSKFPSPPELPYSGNEQAPHQRGTDCRWTAKRPLEAEGSVPSKAPSFTWEFHCWERAAEQGKGVLPRSRGMAKFI